MRTKEQSETISRYFSGDRCFAADRTGDVWTHGPAGYWYIRKDGCFGQVDFGACHDPKIRKQLECGA